MRVCWAMYFSVCSLWSSLDIPSNNNFLLSSLAGPSSPVILFATPANFSNPLDAVPPNNAKSFEPDANNELNFSISALVKFNFSKVVLTPLIPCAVVSPTSLSLLNESYTLSLYSAPISISLVDFSNARPNKATTPPNTFTAVPTPVNIITPPIRYKALDTVSFKSFIALAPTLAPRSPLNKASAIPVAALTTPLITEVAKVRPAAIPTLLPVISNIFSCI